MPAITSLLATATADLQAAGVGSPRVDAELLLAHVAGSSRTTLLARESVDDDVAASFADVVRRRVAREPLQHIVGAAPFRHLELAVGPGVFVPRPETELLVDAALRVLAPDDLVVDLCAGSGALGLAILNECPGVRVIAVERDGAALDWLRRNGAGTELQIVEADVSDPNLLFQHYGQVDVVVSNPPYVPDGVAVDPEVHADPPGAVFAGADGLALLPAVIARAAELLHIDGLFVVEHDDTHSAAIEELLELDGRWADVVVHPDLAGRPRFATASRAEAALPTA